MQTLVIALASDQKYFPGLYTTVTSIICSTSRDTPIDFFVLDGGLTDESWRVLEATACRYNRSVEFERYPLDVRRLNGLRPLHGSLVTYARLLLPDLLPHDKAIYLDTGLLVLKDVRDLWNMRFDGAAAVAVQDQAFPLLKTDCPWLNDGINGNSPYFNAGMILIDLGLWRRFRVHERAFDLAMREPEKCRFHDQTSLNYVLHGQVKMIDRCWNWWPNRLGLEDGEDWLNTNIHYLAQKPWLAYLEEPRYEVWYRFHDVWCDTRFPAALQYGLMWSWTKRSVWSWTKRALVGSFARWRPTRSVLKWTLSALGRDWSPELRGADNPPKAAIRRAVARWRQEQEIRVRMSS